MLKKASQRGRRECGPRGVLGKYVEGVQRPRTKLGAFFSILLEVGCHRDQNIKDETHRHGVNHCPCGLLGHLGV